MSHISCYYNVFVFFFIKDLALLRIDPPFKRSDDIQPIPINDKHRNLIGYDVLISGWGMTTSSLKPTQLSSIHMKITNQTYDKRGGQIIEMISDEGEGYCIGDSGGNNHVKCNRLIVLNISTKVVLYHNI